jgi:hypothetical protein
MRTHTLRGARGQALLEFAFIMPIICVLALGVVEMSWALLDAHIVTRLAREGANLISRDSNMTDASSAMRAMNTRPVNFDSGSKLILSVIKNVSTVGAANYNTPVLYQRYEYGSLPDSSKLTIAGSGSFGGAPEYQAVNSDNNTGLRVTNLPAGVGTTLGGMVYIAEIYSPHAHLTPFNAFGFSLPTTLYSIAYF